MQKCYTMNVKIKNIQKKYKNTLQMKNLLELLPNMI